MIVVASQNCEWHDWNVKANQPYTVDLTPGFDYTNWIGVLGADIFLQDIDGVSMVANNLIRQAACFFFHVAYYKALQ